MDQPTAITTNTHPVDLEALRLQLEEDGRFYSGYQNPEEAHQRLLHTLQTNDCREIVTAIVDGDDLADAFVAAGGSNHADILEAFANRGMNIDIKNKNGWTALVFASCNGREQSAQFLLNRNASMDAQDQNGETALMLASECGHIKNVEMLLGKNANFDFQSTRGKTALMRASANGHKEVVRLLLTYNASIELKNSYGETALDLADDEEIKELFRNHVTTTGYLLK